MGDRFDSKRIWGRLEYGAALLVFALAFGLTYYRTCFGVDFADESFYSSIPYSFILGNKPFFDEISVVQLSSFLVSPLYWLYLHIHGSIEGSVLFIRHSYFAYAFFATGLSYRFLRRYLNFANALLGSAVVLTFTHLNILSLGYYAFLSLGFLCGCLLSVEAVSSKRAGWVLFFSVLFHSTAIFVYPSIIWCSGPSVLSALYFLRSSRSPKEFKRALAGFTCAALIALTAAISVIRYAGAFNLQRMMNFIHVLYGPVVANKFHRFKQSYAYNPSLFVLFLTLVSGGLAMVYFNRKRGFFKRVSVRHWRILIVCVLLLFFNPFFFQLKSHKVVILFGLLGPLVLLYHQFGDARKLAFTMVLPSFLAGAIASWTSGNGPRSAAPVLFASALVTFLLANETLKKISTLPLTLILMATVSLEVANQYREFSNEHPLGELAAVVPSGAFRGLHTTPEKAALLEDLTKDLSAQLQRKDDTILFYNDFPAGFLLTDHRPRTPSTWLFAYPTAQEYITQNEFKNKHDFPDYIVEMNFNMWEKPVQPDDIFRTFFRQKGYREVLKRPKYSILKLAPN